MPQPHKTAVRAAMEVAHGPGGHQGRPLVARGRELVSEKWGRRCFGEVHFVPRCRRELRLIELRLIE